MQGRPDDDVTAADEPETMDAASSSALSAASAALPTEPRADTAISPVIRGASVSIPTPAWGTALALDDTEVVIAELVDDTGQTSTVGQPSTPGSPANAGSTTATGSILIPEPVVDRRPVLGALAVVAAIATIVLHSIAVNAAAHRDPETATMFAWIAIVMSLVAIALGILAAIFRSGRWTGAVAAVVALFANPWVLLQVLTFFAS